MPVFSEAGRTTKIVLSCNWKTAFGFSDDRGIKESNPDLKTTEEVIETLLS